LADGAINTLDDYYSKLNELIALARENNNYQHFLRLPLDEPTFDIDANSRVITVPAEFKKNGLSVKNDEIAEIVYFTIDRYYDTIDLYSPDINIIIQWEGAPDAKKESLSGLSAALFRDCIRIDGNEKVIFGWAIDGRITKNAGTIKFAVHFYMLDAENKFSFNLNTLA